MAPICNEGGSKEQKGNPASASCGCGNTDGVRQKENNSVRGAALALCMSVEELRELLDLRNGDEQTKKVAELRSQISELKSENAALKQLLEQRNDAFKALSDFIVVKF